MEMEDLVGEVAGEVADGDKSQIGILLLTIIGTIICELIKWFFQNYTKDRAAQEFVNYYNKMGPFKRMSLLWQVRREMRRNPGNGFSADKIATCLADKFQKISVQDVEHLASKLDK